MAGVVISKKAKTENVLPMIPDHVIEEILQRLPVKSLLRFTCVCKTWCSVISDPQFFQSRRPCVLIGESKKFSTITIESLLTSKNRAPTPLSLPWETEADDQNQILGSCNGLVLVDLKSESSPDRSGFILWNPSTRKFRKLPRPTCYQVQDIFFTYAWFGYDESVDDYKLVWLNCSSSYRLHPIEPRLDVFTLKSNTWRRPPIDHIPSMSVIREDDNSNPKSIGFLSNGAIHWDIYYDSPSERFMYAFLALDLATEKCRLLKFPHIPIQYHSWVGSLGGCLCLSTSADKADKEEFGRGVSLWMMKEYGVESSWTKLIWIPYTWIPRVPSFSPFFRFYPILFSKEEDKEIAAIFDYVLAHIADSSGNELVRLRIEGGGENVRFQETQHVSRFLERCLFTKECPNIVVLPMEESLVSLTAAD